MPTMNRTCTESHLALHLPCPLAGFAVGDRSDGGKEAKSEQKPQAIVAASPAAAPGTNEHNLPLIDPTRLALCSSSSCLAVQAHAETVGVFGEGHSSACSGRPGRCCSWTSKVSRALYFFMTDVASLCHADDSKSPVHDRSFRNGSCNAERQKSAR